MGGGRGGKAGALSWQVNMEGGVLRQNGLAQRGPGGGRSGANEGGVQR